MLLQTLEGTEKETVSEAQLSCSVLVSELKEVNIGTTAGQVVSKGIGTGRSTEAYSQHITRNISQT